MPKERYLMGDADRKPLWLFPEFDTEDQAKACLFDIRRKNENSSAVCVVPVIIKGRKSQADPEMVEAVNNTVGQLTNKFCADLVQQIRRLVESTPEGEARVLVEGYHMLPCPMEFHITVDPDAELIQNTVTFTDQNGETMKGKDLGIDALLKIIAKF